MTPVDNPLNEPTAVATVGIKFLSLTHRGVMSEITQPPLWIDLEAAQWEMEDVLQSIRNSPMQVQSSQVRGGGGPPGGGSPGGGGTMGTQATALTPAPPGISGNPPSVFDGNRTKSEDFMSEFRRYWLLNPQHPNLVVPAQQIVWCLTFMRGSLMADWVWQKTDWVEDQIQGGRDPDNTTIWTEFKKAFSDAFTDTGKEQSAFRELTTLAMKGGDLDEYITRFDTLIGHCGWGENEPSTIYHFCKGLANVLHKAIINHVYPRPTNLQGWKKAAQEQQSQWIEDQAEGFNLYGPKKGWKANLAQ